MSKSSMAILSPFLYFAIFCQLLSITSCQIPPVMQLQIDNLIDEYMEFHNVPGMGLTVIKDNGDILYTTGYGFRDVEDGIASDDATTFGIGSISKSFTATVIVKALNELFPELGEDALDIPIRQLLPKYNFTLGDRYRSESATMRDLLSHTTCLLPESLGLFAGPFETTDEFVFRQRYAPEVCQFRTGFVHNNGIISVASHIIGFAAGSSFEDMLQDLFNEIGMTDSTWVKNSDDHNMMAGRSIPYYQVDGKLLRLNPELLKVVIPAIGSGGILSSARDMAKYMEFHLNYGRIGNNQIVPVEVMKWIHRASNLQVFGRLKSGETDIIQQTYAYGLCVDLGIYDVQHGGYIPSYESLMTLVPELHLGIFTTMNGPGSTYGTLFQHQTLHIRLIDIIRGKSTSTRSTVHVQPATGLENPLAIHKRRQSKPTKSVFKAEPGDVVGYFGSGQSGEIEGSIRTNSSGDLQPYASYGKWGQAWLTQITSSSFEMKWDSDIEQVFIAGGATQADAPFVLEFKDMDTIVMTQNGVQVGTDFIRNLKLEDLPITPWAPDSCGPEL